jgi:hypothetical protein
MIKRKMMAAFLGLFVFGFCSVGWSGKIIYPWNATTAIVKAGETFEVWFDADSDQTVSAVLLRGPYNTVAIPSVSRESGSWIYDPISSNTYNTLVTVTVPPDTPTERYDVVLNTSSGDAVSRRAVKVIAAYKSAYTIMHISDTHMCQGAKTNGHPERLFKISALADMGNIAGVEMLFVTGDLINNNMFPPKERSEFFYDGYEKQGLKGIHGFDAATFAVVGNHDFLEGEQPGHSHHAEKAEFWNEFHGLQTLRFNYGHTRCMLVNDGWNGFDWSYQLEDHASWLSIDARGDLRIAAYHKSEMGIMGEWANAVDLGLAMIGHNHHLAENNPYELGGRPIQYYANSVREYMNCNLFRVEADGSYSAVNNISIMENPKESPAEWRPKLTLDYQAPNNGSALKNSVQFVNNFEVGFPRARVRFILPKGRSYSVSKGTVEQAFDGDSFHVVDVRVPISANSTTSIDIFPSVSPAAAVRTE